MRLKTLALTIVLCFSLSAHANSYANTSAEMSTPQQLASLPSATLLLAAGLMTLGLLGPTTAKGRGSQVLAQH